MGWRVFDLFGWVYFIFSSVREFIAARMQNATSSNGAEELIGSDGALVRMGQDDMGPREHGNSRDENSMGPRQHGNNRDENSENRPVITIENHGIVVVGDQATINGTKEKKNNEDLQI